MARRPLIALAALLLAAGVALVLHLAGTPGAPRPLFGADFSTVFQDRPFDRRFADAQLAAAARDGIRLARAGAYWETTEVFPPREGHRIYDWHYDDFMSRAMARHGLTWLPIVAYSAPWASSVPGELHAGPRPGTGFAAYAGAFARRYGRQVATYEIWNEPNSAYFWKPRPDPAAYANLFLAARAAIRRADPGARVLIGGLVPGTRFLEAMLAARPDLRGRIDGVSVHAYADTPGGVLAHVRARRLELRRLGEGNVPLWVTEYGWSPRPAGSRYYAPAARRPGYLAATSRALLSSDCDVAGVTFFAWSTSEEDPGVGEQWLGVHPPGGGASPATRAVAGVARALGAGTVGPRRAICG